MGWYHGNLSKALHLPLPLPPVLSCTPTSTPLQVTQKDGAPRFGLSRNGRTKLLSSSPFHAPAQPVHLSESKWILFLKQRTTIPWQLFTAYSQIAPHLRSFICKSTSDFKHGIKFNSWQKHLLEQNTRLVLQSSNPSTVTRGKNLSVPRQKQLK